MNEWHNLKDPKDLPTNNDNIILCIKYEDDYIYRIGFFDYFRSKKFIYFTGDSSLFEERVIDSKDIYGWMEFDYFNYAECME